MNDTYLLAGYALWRLQRQVDEFELDDAVGGIPSDSNLAGRIRRVLDAPVSPKL